MKFALLLLPLVVSAQVTVKFTPESMAITAGQLKNANAIGRWQQESCLSLTSPIFRDLNNEDFSIAAPTIPFIDWADAVIYLSGAQRKSKAAKVVNGLAVAAGLTATGAEVSSVIGRSVKPTNARVAGGLAIGALVLQLMPVLIPSISGAAQSQVPQLGPLVSPVKYPYRLQPGGCFTDHRYAGKVPKPEIVVVVIK